jgi:hypothetical protein
MKQKSRNNQLILTFSTVLFSILSCLLANNLQGQSKATDFIALKKKSTLHTMYHRYGNVTTFYTYSYVFNVGNGVDQELKPGGENLRPFVKNNPEAARQLALAGNYYSKMKQTRAGSIAGNLVGALGVLGALVVYSVTSGKPTGVNTPAVTGCAVLGVGGYVLTFVFANQSKKLHNQYMSSLEKGVEIYNDSLK